MDEKEVCCICGATLDGEKDHRNPYPIAGDCCCSSCFFTIVYNTKRTIENMRRNREYAEKLSERRI